MCLRNFQDRWQMDTVKLTFILTHLHRQTDYSTIFTDDLRKMTESEENVL